MTRVLVQLLNMRPNATSGMVFTRQLVPALVRELGEGNVVLLASVGAGFTVGTALLRWAI